MRTICESTLPARLIAVLGVTTIATGGTLHAFQEIDHIRDLFSVNVTSRSNVIASRAAVIVTDDHKLCAIASRAGVISRTILWDNQIGSNVSAVTGCILDLNDMRPSMLVAAVPVGAGEQVAGELFFIKSSEYGSASRLAIPVTGRIAALAASHQSSGDSRDTVVLFTGVPEANKPGVSNISTSGEVTAYDLNTTSLLWRRKGDREGDYFGWNLILIPDISGDGIFDVAVAAPALGRSNEEAAGQVLFLSGRDGEVLRTCEARRPPTLSSRTTFGASLGLIQFGPDALEPALAIGCVGGDNYVLIQSIKSGQSVKRFEPSDSTLVGFAFGRSIAQIPDIDGDAAPDFVIGNPDADWPNSDCGELLIMSGRTGLHIGSIHGSQSGEGFGVSVALAEGNGDAFLCTAAEGPTSSLRAYRLSGISAVVAARRAAQGGAPR